MGSAGARRVALVLFAGALASCDEPQLFEPAREAELIGRALDGHADGGAVDRATHHLYARRGFRAVWTRGPIIRRPAVELIERVRSAADEGLDPEDYGRAALDASWSRLGDHELDGDEREEVLADLDVALTRAYLLFAAHQAGGRVDPDRLRPRTITVEELEGHAEVLDEMATKRRLERALDRLNPTQGDYRRLTDELAALRRGSDDAGALDEERRAKVRALIVNLERRRWLPKDLGPRWVLVNVAAATLEAHVEGHPTLEMRVVVGRRYRETPLFSSTLTRVVLNPSWYVPDRLAAMDLLPLIQKDPRYLADKGFRVLAKTSSKAVELDPTTIDWASVDPSHLPVRLVQDPGPENALGRVELVLPNPYEVFFHDTPSTSLFTRERRSFSSGCIRLERPIDLAVLLLDGTSWTKERLAIALEEKKTRVVPIEAPTPAHLVYWTAWVDASGHVVFGADPYDRDRALARVTGADPRVTRP